MRAFFIKCCHLAQAPGYDAINKFLVNWFPFVSHEKMVDGLRKIFLLPGKVFFNYMPKCISKRNDAFFVSFSQYFYLAVSQINIAVFQVHEFRETHAGGIKQFKNQLVTI